ncbi:MAG: sugar ABC transporter ATP-binding protein [Bacteroidetes bacterium]|nr:MAG: sugar ABC transporter ATP-binding protein [Bacteroidota bacterium]
MSLEIKQLAKRYGSVVAIRQASLKVNDGEVMAILGGNGSGKSTLAKIIGGAVNPSEGIITYGTEKLQVKSPKDAKRKGIVITSQELSLFDNLSVKTNLLMCEIPRKFGLFVDKNTLEKRAEGIMGKMGISHLLDKPTKELAPNEQYMVEFAKALIQEPKVLIIDEITSALYREDVEMVKNLVAELKRKGCMILFISHRMSEIFSMCDSVTVMKNGETIGTFGINEKSENELLSLMTGKDLTRVEESEVVSHGREDKAEMMLSIKNLKLQSFSKSIDLEVRKGEIIGVAGLQGHGQSDLVRTLFGLQQHIKINLDGKQIDITNPYQSVQAGLAFISGDREREGVYGTRSISENLRSVKELVTKQGDVPEEELLKDYGVVFNSVNQPINTLSGGNQQKVVIGRWMATEPKVVLADDPTKGIDVQARRDVHRILHKLAEKGSAVIMVSSDDEELVELTKRVKLAKIIVMYEGQISAILKGSDITTENIISASMPIGV